jgi:hypothetical protein
MADFKIDGRMKVKSLKKMFKEEFGSTLRVYKGMSNYPADDDASIASLNDTAAGASGSINGSEVKAHGLTKVKKFEDQIAESFGFKVQVATPDDQALVDNGLSLSESAA